MGDVTGARRSGLSLAQLDMWRDLSQLTSSERIGDVITRDWPLPPGTDVDTAMSALATLSARHDGLRCVLTFDDRDCPQRVLRATPTLAAQVASDAGAATPPLDFETGPLWTATVLADRGQATSARVTVHYLLADAEPMEILRAELNTLIVGGDLRPAPSSFDLTDEQRSPRWAQRRNAALARWVEVARSVPVDPDELAEVSTGTPRWARLRSAPALHAARDLATRTHTSVPTVILAALCRLVGAGRQPVGIGLQAGNRSSRRWRDVVCPMGQLTAIRFEHRPGEQLADTAARVHRDALTAYANAMYDVDEASAAVARYGMPRVGAGLAAIFSWVGPVPERLADPAGETWTVDARQTGADNGVRAYLRASASDGALLLRLEQRPVGSDAWIGPDYLRRLHADLAGTDTPPGRASDVPDQG